jgi:5'-3' exonuclease|uniref:XPG N-terminal domain-containing protein n=1 Tax=viral metagenome TaxID=1070528 RepID=A0A6C0IUP6_9ZZZZ
MGIKNLNRFLKEKCGKKSIYKTTLSTFENKTLVIDTSIYLYQFIGENALMENMYLFISIMKSCKIIPIFIFDGKPPQEKRELIKERSTKKKIAETKFNELCKSLEEKKLNEHEKRMIEVEMDALKRQFIRVQDKDIANVKKLMDAYGVVYYDAPNEADELCAYFVKMGLAYGCISDDMDMFLYGCPIVLRNFSLLNQSVSCYETVEILKDLDMSEQQFREILVISGTDYNRNMETTLHETLKWFQQYKQYINHSIANNRQYYGFYLWLTKNTKYVKDFHSLIKIHQLFVINDMNFNKDKYIYVKKIENNKKLQEIMSESGFIFS